MTPRDFLYSVMLEDVDRKVLKKVLTKKDVDDMLNVASRAQAGDNLFRNIGDNGLISYTEYLFLLTIVTSKCLSIACAMIQFALEATFNHLNQERKPSIAENRQILAYCSPPE